MISRQAKATLLVVSVILTAVCAFHVPATIKTTSQLLVQPEEFSSKVFARSFVQHRSLRTLLAAELTPGIGEGRNLPAPSGVNEKPEIVQAAIVLSIMAGLVAGTAVFSAGLDSLEATFPGFFAAWKTTWPLLGPGFVLAGVSHFTLHEDFCNIYPPKGTWGFWYLPGSPSFHVNWTGVIEILGGVMLTIGGISAAFGIELPTEMSLFLPDGALLLCALTYVVSFANIYMYTHGAILPEAMKEVGEVPIAGHIVRGILQVILLSLFWQMGRAEPLISSLL